jgi:sugar phosphate isomerase/epimerase
MRLLLHTIALDPARWTPQRVSRPLTDILPSIAAMDFQDLEIYEPHLTEATVSAEIKDAFARYNLTPEILSSYLNVNPAVTTDSALDAGLEVIRARIAYYGFRKLRLFPGPGIKPSDSAGKAVFVQRLKRIVSVLPDTDILLETHDGSLADDPATITQIAADFASTRVGLLFQPTLFEPEAALRQFEMQKPFIRHLHLQNRNPDLSMSLLSKGVVPWERIFSNLPADVAATLEFVPVGICSVEAFDLPATLRQVRDEAESIRELGSR